MTKKVNFKSYQELEAWRKLTDLSFYDMFLFLELTESKYHGRIHGKVKHNQKEIDEVNIRFNKVINKEREK